MDKKLRLSITDKKIGGVCGGFGEFFGLDATLIRVAWVFSALLGGVGVLGYLICWAIIPNPQNLINK